MHFNHSFFLYSRGNTGPSFMKGKWIMPSHIGCKAKYANFHTVLKTFWCNLQSISEKTMYIFELVGSLITQVNDLNLRTEPGIRSPRSLITWTPRALRLITKNTR